MAREADYRPAAPGDGMGNISQSDSQLEDPEMLDAEAWRYAKRFQKEEDTRNFYIGVTTYSMNRATVYTIEASRLLCAAQGETAAKLLRMAIKELEEVARRKS
jgi:hypothetical protein